MENFKVGDFVVSNKFNKVLTITEVQAGMTYYVNEHMGRLLHGDLRRATNDDLAKELQSIVEKWVDQTFNMINVSVYEKCLDNMLFEHIEPVSDEDINDKVGLLQEKMDELEDSEEITDEIQSEIDEIYGEISELENERDNLQEDNYPMWNTLFEQKSEWAKLTQFAQNIGMGLINSNDYFNETLFTTSCGHSFYSAYWIPLYLCLFGETIATKYKNVNYEGL